MSAAWTPEAAEHGRCFTCSGGGTVPARVPGRWVDCLNCDGTGTVPRTMTLEQRVERIEKWLNMDWGPS